jgi:electron transfer flavoprotein alpha subunit
MTVLVIADHNHATLNSSTRHAITAAVQCDADVHVLIAGHNCGNAAQAAARVAGVTKVLVADAPHLADGLAEDVAPQILALAAHYTHLLAPAGTSGKNILPRVAALLDVDQISEISKVVAPDTFQRPTYAGNAIATVRSADAIKVITVRVSSFAAAADGGQAEVAIVPAADAAGTSRLVSRALLQSDRPELGTAKVIIAGGRGMGSADNFQILEPLADRLGAALGASRAAVDAGFVPNDWQIGQTGKVVAPQLYIAVGISGAIQHLAGMKEAKTIVAINKDPEAPIFSVADYGIVGDLFEIVPQLHAALA